MQVLGFRHLALSLCLSLSLSLFGVGGGGGGQLFGGFFRVVGFT